MIFPDGYDIYADFGITPDQLERLIAAGLISPIEATPLPPDTEIIVIP